jgi:hypothetical protein
MEISYQWNRLARLVDPQAKRNPDLLYTEAPKLTALWKKVPVFHEGVPYEQQQVDVLWAQLALQYPGAEATENWLSSPSPSPTASVLPSLSQAPLDTQPAPFPVSSTLSMSSEQAQPCFHISSQPASSPEVADPPGFFSSYSSPTVTVSDTIPTPTNVPDTFSPSDISEVEPSPDVEIKTSAEGSPERAAWANQEEEVGRVLSTGDVSNHLAFKEAVVKLQGLAADSVEIDLARIQGRGPNFNEFLVEHAKSGRATCASCRKSIDQGTLRIANTYFAVGFDGNKYYWRHWWCFARSQKNVNSPEQWDGWNRLKDADKAKIKKLVPRPVAYGLTRVPGLVSCFSNAKTLDLRENSLEVLPPELGGLRQLERLDLNHNQLKELPEVLLRLPNLKWVDLRNNPLASSEGIADVVQLAKQHNPLLKIEI